MDSFLAKERAGGDPPSGTAAGRYGYEEVVVIPWPSGEDDRRRAAAAGTPRLLVVEGTHAPPEVGDGLEDWLREPADPVELYTRRERLRRRMETRAPVELDQDGLLHRGARWVALSPTEQSLMRLLVERQGAVVSHTSLVAAIGADGRLDPHRDVRSFVRALRHRLAPLGLHVHNVRGAGFLLQADELPGA
jgi:Transcriptional regulatory protein, C terminal